MLSTDSNDSDSVQNEYIKQAIPYDFSSKPEFELKENV